MGLRGPGAKPIKKPQDEAPKALEPPAWEAPGLSRLDRVVAFMEALPITSGVHAGRPFKVRPWQRKHILAPLYPARGARKVRTAVVSLGRKNGKTDIAARLALCHLAGPEAEPRGEVYSAANDRFQAGKTFQEMAAIVEAVPWLSDRISIKRHSKEMEDIGGTGSIYAALSADVATKMGLSPSFVVYDELGQATSRDLFDALDTAMGARAEPVLLVISTQAPSDTAPMSELIDYGLKCKAGDIDDPTFHLAFFHAPDDADPWVEATWRLANPALGDFRSIDDVKRMAAQAQRLPSKEAAFRNLILNQRVAAEGTLIPAGEWRQCGADIDVDALVGRPCYAGLDLSQARDLTALVLVFDDGQGGFDVVPWFWLPADGLAEKADRDRAAYVLWRDQGFLQTTPGPTIDPRFIAAAVARLHARYDIRALAFDRWRVGDFQRALSDEGCEVRMEPFGQGFKEMAPAIDRLERHVAARSIRHPNHPVLTMCTMNAIAVADPAGNRKLDKARSTGRIDGLVALAMALAVAARDTPEPVWEPAFAML